MAPNSRSELLDENSNSKIVSDDPDLFTDKKPSTLPGFQKYPKFRNLSLIGKTVSNWYDGKVDDDGIGRNLWRVHDKLYDFTPFVKLHPGGSRWLNFTKGTDITELFESSHLTKLPSTVLDTYYIADATTPRNSPYTFKEDGFYKTLQRRVWPIIAEHGKDPSPRMHRVHDFFILSTVLPALLGAYTSSIATSPLLYLAAFILFSVSGLAFGMLIYCTHNYIHQKSNWRMYVFNLSFLSHEEWQLSHVISHHVYPNSINDWEVAVFEPILNFMAMKKSFYLRYLSVVSFHFTIMLAWPFEAVRRVVTIVSGKQELKWFNFVPLALLLPMIYVSGSVTVGTITFLLTQLLGSYYFLLIGLAVHHHPDNFHEGDAPRQDMDWGLCQIDTVQERIGVSDNLFLTSGMLGDHQLHHLFPVIDHSKLHLLYPVFLQTLKEFGVPHRVGSLWEMTKGCFRQLMKVEGNLLGHDLMNKIKNH